jgi:murein DD-endopeptidase MepM/ murein hydrolase activator NlpD
MAHAGRQVRIGPVAFWIVVGTLVIMAAWTITTATYFAFREDVLTRLVGREAEMQFAYEDRIAELRAQIDRLSSRQLLNQEQYEQKLDQLLRRQTTLESHAGAIGALGDSSITGSVKPGRTGPAVQRGAPTSAPAPIPGREGRLDPLGAGPRLASVAPHRDIDAALTSVQTSLDRVDTGQRALLGSLAERYDAKARRMRGALADLGIDASKVAPRIGVGGPFVALPSPNDAAGFERQITRINVARAQVEQLSRALVSVPVRKPIGGEEVMSGFGVRIDPFNNRPAMHTGLDLHAEVGDPVQATANGTVAVAGWSGGYGKMVEIDHGRGLVTRYGHLSEIDVKVGQPIKLGQVVGKVGTTGRSTGPHLHYETRVEGEAVDPQKFLHAGAKLVEVQ